MPKNKKTLGTRRKRATSFDSDVGSVASRPRRSTLDARRLPRRVVEILGGGSASDASSVDYGDSRTIKWNKGGDATNRYALWNSLGGNAADIDATVAELARERSEGGSTRLQLTLEPTSVDSGAAIARALDGIDQHNETASEAEQIDVVTRSVPVRAMREGWVDGAELDLLRQHLGDTVADQLMLDAMDSVHPSRIRTMATNLEAPPFWDMGNDSSVVLGDGMRAWTKVDDAVEQLLTPPDGDPTKFDVPDAAFNPPRDLAWVRAQTRALLQRLQPATKAELERFFTDIAEFRRGRLTPLLARLGSTYQDRASFVELLGTLPLDKSGVPTGSVVAQAAGVLAELQGTSPLITVQTLAQQGGDLVDGAIKVPDRSSTRYKQTIAELRRRNLRVKGELDEARLTELADIIEEARRTGKRPRLVTTDWGVMRMLRGLRANDAPLSDTETRRQDSVVIEGVSLDLRAVESPSNDYPTQTEVGRLARSLPDTLKFGQPVKVTFTDGSKGDAYVWGYTPEGRARVLLKQTDGSEPEVLYTLSGTESVAATEAFAPLPEDSFGGTAVTRKWKSKTYGLDAIDPTGAVPTPLETMLISFRDGLRGLRTRQVADSTLTADQYTDLIKDGNFKSYIVGGATRDILIGKDPNDIDFASTMPAIDTFEAIVSSPDNLGKKSGAQGQLAVRKNVPFGAVQVEADHPSGLDIISTHDDHNASLRLDLDALARDFTVNAVYYDIADDAVVDPTGRGLDDLLSRTVRFVAGPADEVMKDSPILVARWLKMMSKQDARGNYFQAADDGDVATALKWLDHHSQSMDPRVARRFVDRMTTTAKDAEARVRRIFASVPPTEQMPDPVQTAVDAIHRIYGAG
ncbi:MAG: CCA tRNA nucleotidyltransferase [Myxococcales bacterium]|nr:CCA tRNA nucleotidyltransferase [Myxococcales bacterium]